MKRTSITLLIGLLFLLACAIGMTSCSVECQHEFTGWQETKAPTCTTAGTELRTCNLCGESEERPVSALGHKEVPHDAQAPTCTEDGWDAYVTCSVCDYTTFVLIPAPGHDEVSHEAQAPTCTEDGWDAYVSCSVCDYTTIVVLPAPGHDEVNHAAQEVTCTVDGWDAYVTCSACDYTTFVLIPATGHDEISHEAQAVTCTEDGWDAYVTCSACDYTTFVLIPATGHDEIGHAAQAVTCTVDGWDAYVTCSACDYTTFVLIPAPGHNTVTRAAKAVTCTTNGWDAYTACTNCSYNTRVIIPATGHDEIGHPAQAGSCTEDGWNAYVTCSACDYTTFVLIPAPGHQYTDNVCGGCGQLDPNARVTVSGVIYESDNDTNMANNATLSGVVCTITAGGQLVGTYTSDANGAFLFENLPLGEIEMTFSQDGYIMATYTATVTVDRQLEIVMDADVSNTLSGRITIADSDMDFSNNAPLANATVTIERTTSTNTLRFTTTTDANGNYSFTGLTAGVYAICISCDGYITVNQTVQVRQDETNIQNIVIEAISNTQINDGYASGYLTDARTGLAVGGVSIVIRAGINNTTGPVLMTVVTDAYGFFKTEALAPGNYTAYVIDDRTLDNEDERYGSITFALKVLSDMTIVNQNATVSNSVGMNIDGMRIVLTWGSYPSDLDSHLSGTIDNNYFHVYYSQKYYGSYVDLDVDDVTAYGPETITISETGNGIYNYYIYNFSGGGDSVLSNSGATVKVYMNGSNTPAYTFYVPAGSGLYWHVFTYNSITGEFTVVNQIQTYAP